MELTELLKKMVRDYFVIVTGTVLGTLLYCVVRQPDSTFGLSYFLWILLFALAGDLPTLIFYSPKELTHKKWKRRIQLHLVVLELVLLSIATYSGIIKSVFPDGVFFAVIILFVFFMVWAVHWRLDKKTAEDLNRVILDRKRKSSKTD